MEAKVQPFCYKKGNNLEVAYINRQNGIKFTIGEPAKPIEQLAVLLPLEELESLILYLKKIAKLTQQQMDELNKTENVDFDVIAKALSVNW